MFTGIIEEIGTVDAIRKGARSAVLVIHGNKIFSDLKIGDSVATNGVCLTATEITGKTFSADVMNETLSRSTLGKLRQHGILIHSYLPGKIRILLIIGSD